MNLTLLEPGEIVRTLDADRSRIRTFMVVDSGLLVERDDRFTQISLNSADLDEEQE